MEPGHKSQGFGRQKADLTCIWSGWWPGGSAAGKWTHALLGLILTCLSSSSDHLHPRRPCHAANTPPPTSKKKREAFNWKTFIPKVMWANFSAFFRSSIPATFWFEREHRKRWKTIQTFKKGGKGKLESNLETAETTNVLSKYKKKEKKKTRLTGEVFICTSVVHANIKHLMSAFFRDTDERKRDARLTLSSHNQTVIRFSKQLAAQLSWHQTLTLQ